MPRLIVYFSKYFPPDRCWISEVTDGPRVFRCFRATYPEVLLLGLDDLAWRAGVTSAID